MILLLKRKQQIFFQSHIQESADFCHILDCQYSSLPNLQLRTVGGCNEAVLGILIYKYFQAVAYLCAFRHLLFRQKYRVLVLFLLTKIHSEFFFSLNYKKLYLS